jgi:hypothetical protein
LTDGDTTRRVGGSELHISDCHLWAEIFYLDSPTDYREYLPASSDRARGGDLVLLDDVARQRLLSTLTAAVSTALQAFLRSLCTRFPRPDA